MDRSGNPPLPRVSGSPTGAEPGWATATLDLALRRAVAIPNIGGPLMMLVVLFGAPASGLRSATMAVSVAASGIAVLAIVKSRVALGWMFLGNCTLATLIWLLAPALDSTVTFANCWMVNLTSISAALLLRGWQPILIPIGVGVLGSSTIHLAHPEWGPNLVQATVVTQTVIGVGVWFAMRFLRAVAAEADDEARLAAHNRRAVVLAEAAGEVAAESSRTLHDTLVNTLGAIANGGRVMAQRELVRARCARDVAAVESLLSDSTRSTDSYTALSFPDGVTTLGRAVGLDVRVSERTDGRHRGGWENAVPTEVLAALRGASHEVLLNVAKHSGTDTASVDILESPRKVAISVTDTGSGFAADSSVGFGIAESIVARCRAHSIEVEIETAPAQGTAVTFHYALESHSADQPDHRGERDTSTQLATTQKRACWAWATSVVGVGVAIEFTNRFLVLSLTWAMLALVASTSLLAWATSRRRDELPRTVQLILIVSAPAAFVLSLAGIDFGYTDSITWQIFGATVPPIILRYYVRSTTPFVVATVALVTVGMAVAAVMWQSGSPYSTMVLVGALFTLPPLAGFAYFHTAIERIGARAEADERAAQADERRLQTRRAAELVRSRWQAAGLQSSVDLLRRIIRNEIDPAAPDVSASASREERYLRQLLMLSPSLLHLSYWLTLASARARERAIELTIRTGDVDAPDEPTARYLGELVLTQLETTAPESAMTVGVFPHPDGACMVIVGDRQTAALPPAPPHLSAGHQSIGNQFMIEVSWQTETDRPMSTG